MSTDTYASLHTSYLRNGLTQTLTHMCSRFAQLIPEETQKPSAQDLTSLLLTFHLNEIELALAFLYYEKTYKSPSSPSPSDLLLLCGFHAKNYFNSGMETYRDALEVQYHSFFTNYRAFANECCRQDIPPTALNDAFTRLRRSPEVLSHYSYDLNYQTDVLKWGVEASFRLTEEKWKKMKESLSYQVAELEWKMLRDDKALEVNESDLLPLPAPKPPPVPIDVDTFPPSLVKRQSSYASDGSYDDSLSLGSPPELSRQISFFSHIPEQ